MKSLKKILPVLLALALVLATVPMVAVSADTWDGTAIATGFESGDGSEANPFIIKTAAQLAYLAQSNNATANIYCGKYFKLGADIDLANKPWQPIGIKGFPFDGFFDGADHTVSGLFVDTEDIYAGLFGYAEGTVIKNISILGTKSACKKYSGTIVGQAKFGSKIINVYAQVDHVIGEAAGGIAGRTESLSQDGNNTMNQIIFCQSNNGKVEGKAGLYAANNTGYVGGIVSAVGHTEVRYCVNNSEVFVDSEAKNSIAGGIVSCHGASSGATIVDHCINTGKVSANFEARLGGIAGKIGHVEGGKVMYCINIGEVVGDNATAKGGITGEFAKLIDEKGYCFNYSIGSADTLPLVAGDTAIADTCDDFYNYEKSANFYIKVEDVTGANALKNLEGFTADIWSAGVKVPEANLDKVLALVNAGEWEGVAPAEAVTTTPAVTTPDATTTPVVTTPAETTTEKPKETEAPVVTTTAPVQNAEKGCGSVVSGTVVIVALAGAAFVAKKKRS